MHASMVLARRRQKRLEHIMSMLRIARFVRNRQNIRLLSSRNSQIFLQRLYRFVANAVNTQWV